MSPYTERVTECPSGSVLCERPTATREPVDQAIIWGAIALAAVCAVIGIGIGNWLSKKVERGASNGADQ